jgi:hypothetical protein
VPLDGRDDLFKKPGITTTFAGGRRAEGEMIAICLLFVSLALQHSEPPLMTWAIEGLGDSRNSIVIIVTPTRFGLTQGVTVKSITLMPVATADDPKPRPVDALKTEATLNWGVRASFTRLGRRFLLNVTFTDGSTHTIDPWSPKPAADPRVYQVGPLQLIAPPPGTKGSWG